MAESYRGLTIRIGGDTSKLTQALRAANQATSQTQSELRKLSQALKLDPGSVEAARLQVGFLGEQAANTAMKLAQLKAAKDAIGSQTGVSLGGMFRDTSADDANTTFGEYASSLDNIAERAAAAKTRLGSFTETLASMNSMVSSFAKEAASVLGKQLFDGFDLSKGLPSVDEVRKAFEQLPETVTYNEKALERLISKLESAGATSEKSMAKADDEVLAIATAWNKASQDSKAYFDGIRTGIQEARTKSEELTSKSGDTYTQLAFDIDGTSTHAFEEQMDEVDEAARKAAEEINRSFSEQLEAARSTAQQKTADIAGNLEDLFKKATKLKGVEFKFDAENIDVKTIQGALDSMTDTLGLNRDHIAEFIVELKAMKGGFEEANEVYRNFLKAERFQDLQTEIVKTEASIKNLVRSMSEMNTPSNIARGYADITESVKQLDAYFKQVMTSAGSMGSILKADPGNMQALSEQMALLSEAQKSVREEAERVRQQLDAYDDVDMAGITDGTKSAAKQLEDATRAADEANQAYTSLTGTIEYYENLIGILEGRGDQVKQVVGFDAYDGMVETLEEFGAKVNVTKENAKQAGEENSRVIDSLRASLSELGGTLDEDTGKWSNVAKAKREADAAMQSQQDAKARKEYEALNASLVEVESRFQSVTDKTRAFAAELAKSTGAAAVKSMFGDTNEISSSLGAAFESAMQRAGTFGEALKFDSTNVELALARTKALSDAIGVGTTHLAELSTAMAKVDTSAVEEMRSKYGSVSEAVIRTTTALRDAVVERAKLEAAMDEASGTEGYADAERAVNAIKERVAELMAEAGKASQFQMFEELQSRSAKAEASLNKLRQSLAAVADEDASATVEAFSQSFGEGIFDDVLRQIDQFDDAIKQAEDRYKQYSEALKQEPSNKLFEDGKVRAYNEAIELANQKVVLLKSTIGQFDPNVMESMRNEFTSFGKAADDAKTKLKPIEGEINRLKQAVQDFADKNGRDAKWVEQFTDAKARIKEIPPELEPVRTKLEQLWKEQDSTQLQLAIASVCARLEEMGADAETAEALVRQALEGTAEVKVDDAAFMSAMQQVSQYARQAGQAIVESASTIDEAYRNMRKTVNATENEFEDLRDEAIAFSQTHITSADTILDMEALGGQLGVAASALREFGEVASNLDIATDIEADEIALKLGQITNVMGDLDESTFENFADSLVRLGNNMAAQESSIMNVAQRMSSVANTAKMSTPELLAWSAAIASTGQRSESAATAVSNTITGIAAAIATGGADLQNFASIAGMTAAEFVAAWNNTPSDALKAFIDGLEGLSDSNTAAIQALENMGISSVRQETALLGLASTVETLDDALEMSQDAFDGVSDQWGQAGDAAIEAEKKSEGFSGSLGILQNNASNLAASLGDTLVPAMDLISTALRGLTDFLDALPAPLKTVIVSVGGTAVAMGTLLPVINQVQKGWKALVAEMTAGELVGAKGAILGVANYARTLISAFVDAKGVGFTFGESLQFAGAAAAQTGVSLAGLGTSLLTMGGVAAAVIAIGALVTALSNAHEQTKRLSEAKQSLTDGTNRLAAAANGATGSEQEVASSIEDVRMSADETSQAIERMAQRQEQLAESIEQRNASFAAQSEMVSQAKEVIDQYANSSNLSYDAQAQLIGAVQMLNKEIGSTYEVVDAANGIIREQGSEVNATTAEIDAYIDKQLQIAQSEALIQSIEDAYKDLWEAENELSEAEAGRQALIEAGADANTSYVASTREAVDANLGMVEAQQQNAAAMQNANDVVEAATRDRDSYREAIASLESQYRDLQYTVDNVSQEEANAVQTMAAATVAFKDAVADSQSIDEFGRQFASLGGTAEDFANLTRNQLVVIANAYDGTVRSIANALQKLGVSFKSAVAETVTAPTRDYKAESKALKKRLDADYKTQKTALDREYKEKQKSLNKQYSAAQKASQKYLKQYKKGLDEEVQAFKDATTAKLAEIKKEYEAKEKLLEQEYERYDTDIDDRIRAIEAEQDAEDAARKQQERQEKLDELNQKVASAKTNKARKEAEKELSDYLADLAAEDTKAQRDAQIQKLKDQKAALKEQLSDRKEELKDSYNLAVETYKAEREAELKLLQEANEAKYEATQEAEQARLEAMKDANTEALEFMKQQNEDYLSDLKEQYDQQVEDLANANDQIVEDVKETVDEIEEAVTEAETAVESGADNLYKILNENGQLSLNGYLGVMNKLPGVMASIFEDNNLVASEGTKEVARLMYEAGDLGLSDYLAVMNNMPGATRVIANETGVALAAQLGMFGEDARLASQGLVDNVKYPMEGIDQYAKEHADMFAAQLATVGSTENANKAASGSKTLREALEGQWSGIEKSGENIGSAFPASVANGVAKDSDKPQKNTYAIAQNIIKMLESAEKLTETVGQNYTTGLANGIVSQAAMRGLTMAATSAGNAALAAMRKAGQVKSPSRKAAEIGKYYGLGLGVGLGQSEGDVYSAAMRLGKSAIDGLSEGELNLDLTQQLIDEMRSKEQALLEQSQRMAEIVERGFDPQLTVQAAYEAIDRIDAGQLRRQQLIAGSQSVDNSTYAPVININIPEMVVREEADVDRISNLIAVKVQRQLNSRIG